MKRKLIALIMSALTVCAMSVAVFALESETGAESQSTATSNSEATGVTVFLPTKSNFESLTLAERDSFYSDANANCQTKEELYDCMIKHDIGMSIIAENSALVETEFTRAAIADYERAGLPYAIEIDESLGEEMNEMDANAKQFLEENDLPPAPEHPTTPYPELSKLHDSIMQERIAKCN